MSSNSKRRRSQPSQTHKGDIKDKTQNALGRSPAETSGGGKSTKDSSARLVQKDYLLSKDQSVEGATLESAVELLSSSSFPATAGFLYEFLMTYRSFTTPAGLFLLLKRRLTPGDIQGSDLALVRLRVVNIFKSWINHCPQDWESTELPSLFEGVLATAQEDAVLLKHLEPLRQLISKIREHVSSSPRSAVPKITLPHYRVQNQLKVIRSNSAEVLAEQFTFIDIENFSDIAPWDLILWSRLPEPEREIKCPDLYRLVDRYYEVGHFVATSIVSEPEMDDRIDLIAKFLDIARAANDLGNFNLLMAIYSGLTHPVLRKLKQTWENVPGERMKQLNSFIKYCDPEDNYDAMRMYIELTASARPCLPFLGGYIAEMSHIHTLSSDYLPSVSSNGDRLINYAKHRKLFNIVSSIRRCNYKIVVKKKDSILSLIRRLHALPSDGLKMKVADLQEGSSYDILETEDESQGQDQGFEAVATPRYPIYDPRNPNAVEPLTDSSTHELDYEEDKPSPKEKASPAKLPKKRGKVEILKSASAGTLKDDGGTASSSGGDSTMAPTASANTAEKPSGKSKTNSEAPALNRKVMLRGSGDITTITHSAPYSPTNNSAGATSSPAAGNVNLDHNGPLTPGSASNHHSYHANTHSTHPAGPYGAAAAGMVTSSSGPSLSKHGHGSSTPTNNSAVPTTRRVGSGNSVKGAAERENPTNLNSSGVVSAPRTITSGNTSRSSIKSTVTHIDSDLDDYNSDGNAPWHPTLAAPGSSLGSHNHLHHSGGGHISTGTSPKDFIQQHHISSASSGLSAHSGNTAGRNREIVTPVLLLPPSLAATDTGNADSDDSPRSPTTTSSSPRDRFAGAASGGGGTGQQLLRANSRNTNPSPIRKTGAAYHSNPVSARSSGKSSAQMIVSPSHSHDPWNPLHQQVSNRNLLATSPPAVLPHHGSSGSLSAAAGAAMSSLSNQGSSVTFGREMTKTNSKGEMKQDIKRYEVAMELLETEEDFVHYLRILVEDAVYPLRQKLNKAAMDQAPSSTASTPRTPQSPHQVDAMTILNEAHLRIIFSNIEALYSFHSLFLEDLHNAVRYFRSGGLGSLFSQYHHGFEAYVEYTNARHRGDLLLEHMLAMPIQATQLDQSLAVCRLFQRQQEVVLSKTRKANLFDLLHLPVHRLPRILILLKEFKASSSEYHPDLPILSDAISKLEHIAMKLPMTQEDAEQSMMQMQVLNKLTGWKDKRKKLRPGRTYSGEFEVKLLSQGTNRFPKLTILLWSDVLFFCRTKESRNTRKKKWAVLGILDLLHVHLNPLTAKQARAKFRDISKDLNKSGAESKTTISWGKHPSIVELNYVGLEWLLSFQSAELGETFLAAARSSTQHMVGLTLSSLSSASQSPGASESAAISVIGSKVYSFGGAFRGQWRNEMWSWDMVNRIWTKIQTSSEPPLARTEHTMCAVGKSLYLHGGQRFGSYIDDMHKFDTETNTWSTVVSSSVGSQTPSPRSGHSLNAIGNKLYLFGGQWFETLHQRHLFNDLYCFDTESQTWTELIPSADSYVPAPRQRHVAQVVDNKLVIFGGSGISSELSDLSIYDPQNNTWRACTEVYGYVPTNRALAGSAVYGKKLVVFGGSCDARNGATPAVASASTETFHDLFVFDVEAVKWSHCWVPVELLPRRAHSIVCNPTDNALCIFGGRVVNPDTGDSEPTSEVLMLHGLSTIINNSIGRGGKLEKLREKVERLGNFAIQHQALLTVVGSHFVPPPSSEGVKWDPLTTKSTFSLLENLGSLVYKARHEQTQSLVAIKVLSHHDCSLEMLDIMAEEMQHLSRCRHPGLVAYHGFAPVSNELWIVSELCMGTSVNYVQQDLSSSILSEKQVSAILVTVLESLVHLHSQNIVHKSIKSSNILLNPDGRIKLTDWGLSPIWKPFNLSLANNGLVAPELTFSGAAGNEMPTHTAATDIYDLGLMVVGLLESFGPGRQLRTRHKFSAEVLDFVSLCTASFAHRRPTAVELLSHPFILPQLQNAQRDDTLRALFADSAAKRAARRSSSVSGPDRMPLDTRKSSGGVVAATGHVRHKSLNKNEEIVALRSTLDLLKQEQAAEREKFNSQIMSLQAHNAGLESRLRAIELLVSNLVIPNK